MLDTARSPCVNVIPIFKEGDLGSTWLQKWFHKLTSIGSPNMQ